MVLRVFGFEWFDGELVCGFIVEWFDDFEVFVCGFVGDWRGVCLVCLVSVDCGFECGVWVIDVLGL